RHEAMSLRESLESRRFVITTELEPPKGTDLTGFLAAAARLKGKVHGINVTDNQRATMRLSSVGGACALALQADLLTAWVLGVRNVLAMTGDPVGAGDHPAAKPVFDLSSAALLETIG